MSGETISWGRIDGVLYEFCGACRTEYLRGATHRCPGVTRYCPICRVKHPEDAVYCRIPIFTGNRFLVVCNGSACELAEGETLEQATEFAALRAHRTGADAYVLKPVRKIAAIRDVVTTDL